MRLTVARPSDPSFLEHEEGGSVSIAMPTPTARRLDALGGLGFAAAWNGCLVIGYLLAADCGGGPFGIGYWFPLLHVAVGIRLLHASIRDVLNDVHVRVGPHTFELVHRPVRTLRGVRRPLATIVGFAVAERAPWSDRARRATWDVDLLLEDGSAVQLGLDAPSEAHARSIAARLDAAVARARPAAAYR